MSAIQIELEALAKSVPSWIRNQIVMKEASDGSGTALLLICDDPDTHSFRGISLSTHEARCKYLEGIYESAEFPDGKLAPPIPQADMAEYETVHGLTVPPLLRHYLCNVSREFALDKRRVPFDFDAPSRIGDDCDSIGVVVGDDGLGTLCHAVLHGEGQGLSIRRHLSSGRVVDVAPLWVRLFQPCRKATIM